MVAVLFEALADVFDVQQDYLLQKRNELLQLCVMRVIMPCADEDAVVGLQLEVLGDVIHYDCFL